MVFKGLGLVSLAREKGKLENKEGSWKRATLRREVKETKKKHPQRRWGMRHTWDS